MIQVVSVVDGSNSCDLLVELVVNEGQLCIWDWIEGNCCKVDELLGGKLVYVYVFNIGG